VPITVHPDHVFINCPFDGDYKPVFDAIVFAIRDLGSEMIGLWLQGNR
jgi:hypothetical protein